MTTIPAPAAARDADIATAVVLRRAVEAEWTRLWSVRSTWWTLMAATAIMLLMGGAAGADFAGEPTSVWVAAELAIVPTQLVFHLLVVLAVTGEYATGMIRSSLQWTPRRGVLLAARAIVAVGVATTASVLLSLVTDALAWAFLGADALVAAGDIARSVATIGLMTAVGGLVSAGIGTLLRSTAGTLTSVFLLMLGLPVLLDSLQIRWLTVLAELLPGYATAALLETVQIRQLTPWTTVTVLAAWTAGTLALGAAAQRRRDA